MANWSDPRGPATANPLGGAATSAAVDAGLRSHMLKVYNYMASGVLLSGIVAMLFAQGGATSLAAQFIIAGGPMAWVIMLAPLAFIMVMSFGINRLSTAAMQALFWAFAVAMGLSLSTVLLRYTGESVATAFFSTSAAFVGLSLFGYTTKRNLSGFGTFLLMGLVGLIVAMLLNAFIFQSGAMGLAISAIGVLIFAGLTAYDTQMIKNQYYQVMGTEFAGKAIIMGSLNLYLDFVNMFMMLLNLFGSRE
ncbi:MAG: Bax inhibitor-1/YccA family protein [Pseudomonadota bacterium]